MATYYKVLEANFEVATDVFDHPQPADLLAGVLAQETIQSGEPSRYTYQRFAKDGSRALGRPDRIGLRVNRGRLEVDKYPSDCGSAMFAAVNEWDYQPTGY